jgi:FlaA1/EpsC-like NDP-sugar epimerase
MEIRRFKFLRYLVYVLFDLFFIGFLLTIIYLDSHKSIPITQSEVMPLLIFSGIVIISKIIVLTIFRIYATINVYFSIIDAIKVGVISFATTTIAFFIALTIPEIRNFSIVQILLLLLGEAFLLIASRFIKRTIALIYVAREKGEKFKIMLIIGAGLSGKMVIDEIRNNPMLNNQIIYIVDDDEKKIGGHFCGL